MKQVAAGTTWTLLAATLVSATGPAMGMDLYCLATGTVNWNVSPPHMILASEDAHGFAGWAEFWIDTTTGHWRGRTIGSRALYTDGGTYAVLADGTGYRQHWVGQTEHGGFESLRIDLTRDPITFMHADRMGFVETGTCIPTDGRQFIDGREVTE